MKHLYSAISQFYDAEALENDFVLEVDGNMSPENAHKMRALGANMFVAGTSAVFNGNPSEAGALIDEFREAIGAVSEKGA
jgi:ribulose-phosphate 3-epimerase